MQLLNIDYHGNQTIRQLAIFQKEHIISPIICNISPINKGSK